MVCFRKSKRPHDLRGYAEVIHPFYHLRRRWRLRRKNIGPERSLTSFEAERGANQAKTTIDQVVNG
jgi:hypothetical protein